MSLKLLDLCCISDTPNYEQVIWRYDDDHGVYGHNEDPCNVDDDHGAVKWNEEEYFYVDDQQEEDIEYYDFAGHDD